MSSLAAQLFQSQIEAAAKRRKGEDEDPFATDATVERPKVDAELASDLISKMTPEQKRDLLLMARISGELSGRSPEEFIENPLADFRSLLMELVPSIFVTEQQVDEFIDLLKGVAQKELDGKRIENPERPVLEFATATGKKAA